MFFDIHCHLNFAVFDKNVEKIIEECFREKIWMVNVGTNYETSQKAVKIAENYGKGVWAAIGLHPIHLKTDLVKIKKDSIESRFKQEEESFDFEKYKKLASSKKVVAVGEIGLDYYWKPKTTKKKELFKKKQIELLSEELKLAEELNLPIIFHCRMAHDDLIEILESKIKNQKSKLKGVIHGFVGNIEQLRKYLEMDFYIGFNGIIFKKIEEIDFKKLIELTPIERILLETDSPYLTPPKTKEKINNPLNVKEITKEIAKIKNLSLEKTAEITFQNAKNFFKLNLF